MLVLYRDIGEKVILGDDIEVKVLRVCGTQVKIGFSAPQDLSIHREEVYKKIKNSNLGL